MININLNTYLIFIFFMYMSDIMWITLKPEAQKTSQFVAISDTAT